MTEDLKSSFVADLGRVLRNYTRTDVMSLLYSTEGLEEYVEILFYKPLHQKNLCDG